VNAKIEIRRGSIDNCLTSDEEFQLVVANPPLLPGTTVPVCYMRASFLPPGVR